MAETDGCGATAAAVGGAAEAKAMVMRALALVLVGGGALAAAAPTVRSNGTTHRGNLTAEAKLAVDAPLVNLRLAFSVGCSASRGRMQAYRDFFDAAPGLLSITNVELVPFAVNMYEYDGCMEGSFGERYECYTAACAGSLDPRCLPANQQPLDPWNGEKTGRALTCVVHDYSDVHALRFSACFGDIRAENPDDPPPIDDIIWECAERSGVDVEALRACTEGPVSLAYARSDMERMLHPRYHYRFSPQIYINYEICSLGEGGAGSVCDCGGSTCGTAEIPRLLCEQYESTCLLPDCELPAECEEALRHSQALPHAEGSEPARCEE